MTDRSIADLEDLWARHSAEWRETSQVASFWRDAAAVERGLLAMRADRRFWELLEGLGVTLLVTREYEHLVMALGARGGKPRASYLVVPHPSGLAVDRARSTVFVASTRNPNQLLVLRPFVRCLARDDAEAPSPRLRGTLAPVRSAFFPGCLYMHDLALIGGRLHANAVGQNAVVRLGEDGRFERVWWPRCIEAEGGRPVFERNQIQLNSIAAGGRLSESFFTASSSSIERRRPGHLDYPVDGRGVLFSARTREPVCRGLTRPHSARLFEGEVWLDNSGYGEVGVVRGGRFEPLCRLPGWTRGLAMVGDVAFVGTSRIIPRFRRYAPGVEPARSRCAVHAVSCRTGERLATLEWPTGNQIFGIDWIDAAVSPGFPFDARTRRRPAETRFFYSSTSQEHE